MGNFINRTLVFINKSFDGALDNANIDIEVEDKLKELFSIVGNNIEQGKIKKDYKIYLILLDIQINILMINNLGY